MIYFELLQEYKEHCTNAIELEGLVELDLHTSPVFENIYAWQNNEPIRRFRHA